MQDVAAHCEWLVREADGDRFIATLYAPTDLRPALYALYAFSAEIARVRDVAREPLPGMVRLQWWRDVIAGARAEEARAHPVASALTAALSRHGLSGDPLIALIEARTVDLYDDPIATEADLDAYMDATSSGLIRLALRILDSERAAADGGLAVAAGRAHALAGLLRAFPYHASQRRLYVPLEVLARHGVRADDIPAGRRSGALQAALADMRTRVRAHLGALSAMIGPMPRAWAPAILPVALVRPLLRRMERRGYDPFTPVGVPQWRRQWLLWRAARNFSRIAG
jgi:phytoene synthase